MHAESSYKKSKYNIKIGGICAFFKYMAFNIAWDDINFKIYIEKLSMIGILYFFKLKHVPVIPFLKGFEYIYAF